MNEPTIIADASALINFLRIDRVDILGAFPPSVLITTHVSAEITESFPEQLERLGRALQAGLVQEIAADRPEELTLFGRLTETHRLGEGESSAIAVAFVRRLALAIDDKAAIRQARALDASLRILGTQDLMVAALRAGIISLPEADAILEDWRRQHRFALRIKTFRDVL
jgi:predicted nucleic acid-binding protein